MSVDYDKMVIKHRINMHEMSLKQLEPKAKIQQKELEITLNRIEKIQDRMITLQKELEGDTKIENVR